MKGVLRWKVTLVAAVTLVVSVFAWYPLLADRIGLEGPGFLLEKRLQLGLDLQGGVHMVVRVNTDDAVLVETRAAADRLGEALGRDGVRTGGTAVLGPGRFRVSGVDPSGDQMFRDVAATVLPEFIGEPDDPGAYTFGIRSEPLARLRADTVTQVQRTLERRVDGLGVGEPFIAVQGEHGDQIAVQLPGVADTTRAREVLGKTAMLEWKLVEAGPARTPEALIEAPGHGLSDDTEILRASSGNQSGDGSGGFYLVRRTAGITGRDLKTARAVRDEHGRPAVAFTLTSDGARRFADFTGANVGRDLAIVLDGRVESAPRIEGRIDRGEGQIHGGFTAQEASDLSLILRSGSLKASMTYLGGQYVGPSLGSASIRSGIAASIAGLAAVAAFMRIYYSRAGVNAIVSVIVNLAMMLGLTAYVGGILTLPGIAGLILTIGMGVDSNVLIFERIKEELRAGKSDRQALAAGFDRVFLTILDTHVASLVAAAFLFQFGSGPVRGFATTLTFGLLSNVFTAVFLSRTLFELTLSRRSAGRLRIQSFLPSVPRPRIDFYRWHRLALALSALVILAGGALMSTRGIPLGIEFAGGSLITAKFQAPVSEEMIQRAIPGDETVQRWGSSEAHEFLIRLPAAGDGEVLAEAVDRASDTMRAAGLRFEVTGSDVIGPGIGAELRRKGLYASLASIAGITGYIAARFRPSFSAGAIAATLHDVLVTLTLLALAGYDLTLNVVAAILTITGYSVNDTLVIFDRVREKARLMRGARLVDVVNTAVNETLGRTVITAGATGLAVLALFLFGGEVLRGFAFAMLVGIVSGTYSTIFIAAPIAVMVSRGHTRRRVRLQPDHSASVPS